MKPLREIMLDVHQKRIRDLYGEDGNFHYNKDSTQICIDDIPINEYFLEKLEDLRFTNKLREARKNAREKVLESHKSKDSDQIFNAQFDHELLGLDHLIDVNKIYSIIEKLGMKYQPEALRLYLTPASGILFFDEVYKTELECIAGNLGHEIYLQSDFDHYCRHTITQNKLIHIIKDYDHVIEGMRERYNSLLETENDLTVVQNELEKIQRRRSRHNLNLEDTINILDEKDSNYIRFVTYAYDYNEDNRILRSLSFYEVMKDKTIGSRFQELIETRR
jgi:hypothetical protein